ncbi:MAG: hypothetical protein ACKV2U_16375 [Bryobacteraceae bacterium]
MGRFRLWSTAGLLMLFFAVSQHAHGAAWSLQELYCHVNGVNETKVGPGPVAGPGCTGGWDFSGYNLTTGLGTITYTTSTVGSNKGLLFFNLDLLGDATGNNAFDESGGITNIGSASAGQLFEIDDSGFGVNAGDIYANFILGLADGLAFRNGAILSDNPTDVAVVMGWNFIVPATQSAKISWIVSTTNPGGFNLFQTDPDDGLSVYYTSSLTINGGGSQIPEPSQMVPLTLAAAWLGFRVWKQRRREK